MKVWVKSSGRRIAPFDDPVTDVWICNRRLSVWQAEMLAGFERVESLKPPCLVVPDTLFASLVVLERFVEQAAGRDAVLVLADSQFARTTTPVQPDVQAVRQGFRFNQIRFVSGNGADPVDVVVDPDEKFLSFSVPAVFGRTAKIGIVRYPVLNIHHWVHILWASHAAGAMVSCAIPWWLWVLKVLWAVIRTCSISKWKILGKLNTIGRGCDIHPTAVVEASKLGNNVTIGPFAHVAFSTLADEVEVMSGAEVVASTIGAGATIGSQCCMRLCVVFPEALSNQALIQYCVVGRRAFLARGSNSFDMNMERDIRVMLDGNLHSTGTRLLGSAYGHEVSVGAGVWMASGRQVPNGAKLVKDPAESVHRVPETAFPGPMVNRGGSLEPLRPPKED